MEYTLVFTEKQLQVLNASLCEAPYKIAAPVINEINKQIDNAKQSDIEIKENEANRNK